MNLLVFTLFSIAVVVAYNDGQFLNPTAVIATFYYPYHTWYIYDRLLNYSLSNDIALSVVRLSYFGLLTLVFWGLVLYKSVPCSKSFFDSAQKEGLYSKLQVILVVLSVLMFVAICVGFGTGASSKRELLDSGRSLPFQGFIATLYATCLVALLLLRSKKVGFRKGVLHPLIIIGLLIMSLGYLVLGERDYLFRYLFGILIVYFMFRRKRASSLSNFIIIALLSCILPISQASKSIFLADWTNLAKVPRFFAGELASAGRNIYMLIDYGVDYSFSHLLSDIMRGVVPMGESLGFLSTSAWYQSEYRVVNDFAGTSGWGFTLVGQGYLLSGFFGVFIVVSITSIILNSMYNKRFLSIYWFLFYWIGLGAVIYCLRSDFASFLSLSLKQGGVICVSLYLLSRVKIVDHS